MAPGLYFHLPFCAVHCTYCPFAVSTDLALQDRYVDALVRELSERLAGETAVSGQPTPSRPPTANRQPPTIDTLYLGGGTPSRTSLANLRRLFDAIRAHCDLAPDAEISMEANPEDVTGESLAAWRALGVNRLSIGVQSFHDDELRAIGRIHDRARAIEAVRAAAASGMRTNLDLILGLPRQSAASFRETLDAAVVLGAGHLSLYMLDLEEKTPLEVQVARGRVTLPDDALVADLYVEAIDRLARAGLAQYEISNFARAGEECRHNLRYWTRGEYHGFGIAAHSFAHGERFANTRDIRRYLELAPDACDFRETLGEDEVRRETLFLSLRQTAGMCYEELLRLCGQEGITWIERGLAEGWLRRKDGRVAFTPAGFLQSNDFISQLF
ncbi:MAG TPA: radical SAM family heme chaperone HemW [Thermoanaerobaculia bacterium]|nr:radical SAM family heme chaperone HemW [Thermoanaerobaculia bacterium]